MEDNGLTARTVGTDRERFEQDFRMGWAIVVSQGYVGRGPNGYGPTDRVAVATRAGISAAKRAPAGITRPQPETIDRAFTAWVRACNRKRLCRDDDARRSRKDVSEARKGA
jgi:hypothetical protein